MSRLTELRRHAATLALGVSVCVLLLPATATAQTAATLYQQAVAREAAARKSPTVVNVRAAVTAYETVVRRYPRSSFSDDALLKGAELALFGWDKFKNEIDLRTSDRLYAWLRREYPNSAKTRQIAPPASPKASGNPQKAPGASTSDAPVAQLLDVTVVPTPRGERVVVEIDREVSFSGDRLVNPDRVYFDLQGVSYPTPLSATVEALSGGLAKRLRMGRRDGQVTRLVLELGDSVTHSTFQLYNPYRLVIDLEGPTTPPLPSKSSLPLATEAAKSAPASPPVPPPSPSAPAAGAAAAPTSAGAQPVTPPPATTTSVATPGTVPAPTPSAPTPTTLPPNTPSIGPASPTSGGDYTLARQLGLGVSRVVIDPGHGGRDPGATAYGINEAELTLDVALRVEQLLKQQPGMDVLLTRRSDVYIALEERTNIANRANADLFLSIHVNAASQAVANGVETYFLNFATNPEAEAVAARENATSGRSMGRLPKLVQQITLNTKVNESREFARMVQTSMVRGLRLQNRTLTDRGVEQAPFVVLIGAEMPSVLSEISFVTNKSEAALLSTDSYKQRIAQALADAVLQYQASLKKSPNPDVIK